MLSSKVVLFLIQILGIDLPSLQVFECKGSNFVILTSLTVIGSLLYLSGIRYSFLC